MQLFQHVSVLLLPFQKQAMHLLNSSNDQEREEMTHLFCQVFTGPSLSSQDPHQAGLFSALFATLTARFLDINSKIRVRVCQEAGALLIAHGNITEHKAELQGQCALRAT